MEKKRGRKGFMAWTVVAQVLSFTDPETKYAIQKRQPGEWACSCSHHVYSGAVCKHMMLAWKVGQKKEVAPERKRKVKVVDWAAF